MSLPLVIWPITFLELTEANCRGRSSVGKMLVHQTSDRDSNIGFLKKVLFAVDFQTRHTEQKWRELLILFEGL